MQASGYRYKIGKLLQTLARLDIVDIKHTQDNYQVFAKFANDLSSKVSQEALEERYFGKS
jgi:hypothetical protein